MKHITYILFLFLLPICTQAQNHVPNGDFEYYTSCPNGISQINRCTGWSSLTNYSTPDYLNTCSAFASIPNNMFGYQHATSGSGYAGVLTYIEPQWAANGMNREIITRAIIPLSVGHVYKVSLSVSASDNYSYIITDNLSVLFHNSTNIISNNAALFNLTPQVTFKNYGVIADTQNWVRISGAFLADSTYTRIAIGGFLHDSLITFDTVSGSGNSFTYYYIDSVVVTPTTRFEIMNHDTTLCIGDSITINFIANVELNPNNVFIAQISDASGSFMNPISLGYRATNKSGAIKGVIGNNIPATGYKIRLISSSPIDTIISNTSIRIDNIDSVIFTVTSNSPVCEQSDLLLNINSTNTATTYSWFGPQGFNSTLYNASISNITTSASGSYYVTSKIYACEHRDTLEIQVKPLPVKPIASNNTPVCEHDSLGLTANSTTSGVNYSWVGANSFTSNSQNPSILNVPTNAGGMYIAAAILNGCSRYDTVFVTVKNAPDTVILSTNHPICTDDSLKLYSDSSTGNVTYTWTGPNNFIANSKDTFIPNSGVANAGWYKMVVNRNGCTYTDSIYALITQTPGAPSITYIGTPLCAGENLNLTATGPINATYSWIGANNFSSTLKNPTRTNITVSDSGTYSVTATLNGCTSPAGNAHISINPTPFVNILSADSICDGETIAITALPSNAGANPTYRWYINAQQQSATGITFTTSTLSNNDVIYCEMTDNVKCNVPYTDQSNTKLIKVLPWLAPAVSISSNPSGLLQPWEYVTFTATATNAGNNPLYQWKRNGQNIVGALGNTWSANNLNDNDTISVELISDYKCPQPTTATSNLIRVNVAVGVSNVNKEANLILAPNPNNGQFTLSGNINYNGVAQIEIINMLGQTVYKTTTTVQNNKLQETVNLNTIASGLYLLRLHTNAHIEQVKFRVD